MYLNSSTVETRNLSMFQDRSRKMGTGPKKKKRERSLLVVDHGRLSAGLTSAVVFKG